MSKTIKTKGIILKISDTPGKDKLLKILTETGVISAFMTFKKSAGKKSFTVDLFTLGEIILYQTDQGNFIVNSITPEETFYKLREDITKLSAAYYFSSLILNSAREPDVDGKLLTSLFTNALLCLVNGEPIQKIKPVFELKFTQILGIEPCLLAEKKSTEYYFALEDGRLYTENKRNCVYIKRTTVLAIYNILNSNPDTAYCIECEDVDTLYKVSENYIMYHTEYVPDSLEFLKGVM